MTCLFHTARLHGCIKAHFEAVIDTLADSEPSQAGEESNDGAQSRHLDAHDDPIDSNGVQHERH